MTFPQETAASMPDSTSGASAGHAGEIASHALGAAGEVRETAMQHVGEVASEARDRTRGLVDDAVTAFQERGTGQLQAIGGTLRQLAAELRAMADAQPGDGPDVGARSTETTGMGEMVRTAAREIGGHVDTWGQRLENGDINDTLGDLRQFARRRPGAFLAGAAGLGFLAGRLGRGWRDDTMAASSGAATSGVSTDSWADATSVPTSTYESGSGSSTVEADWGTDPYPAESPYPTESAGVPTYESVAPLDPATEGVSRGR